MLAEGALILCNNYDRFPKGLTSNRARARAFKLSDILMLVLAVWPQTPQRIQSMC